MNIRISLLENNSNRYDESPIRGEQEASQSEVVVKFYRVRELHKKRRKGHAAKSNRNQ